MKISAVTIEAVSYRLHQPLLTRSSEIRERRGFRVSLQGSGDQRGLGEALPLIRSGTESQSRSEVALQELKARLQQRSGTLDQLLDEVAACAPQAPAAACAFDTALHDLWARVQGVPVAEHLGARLPIALDVNAVIGAEAPAASAEAARRAKSRGFRTLKLKVGRAPPQADEARIAAVRRAVGSGMRLRIDANGAWDGPQALEVLRRLAPLEIELVEQPVDAHDLAGLESLHASSPIPVAVDETLAFETGRRAALGGGIAALAVLKPMVLGGLRPCMRFAKAAHEQGMRCIITTTFEGWVGTAAAAHLAAATLEGDHASGLASAEVLDAPFPPELIPRQGQIQLSERPGLGWTE